MKSMFRVLAVAASLVSIGGPGVAGAAPAAQANKGGGKNADAAKAEAPAEQERTGPAEFTGGRPQLEESKRTAEADRKRDEAIEQLKAIIARLQPGPQKSDALFQLAEFWIEKSKYYYFQEWGELDKKLVSFRECQDAKGLDACGAEPKINNHQSELYRAEALRLYEQILKDSPTYMRKDEVLFALAVNLYEKGDKNGSIARYRDLVTQYPNSQFAGDAYVAMGEHYFAANELAKAEAAYEKALQASVNEPRIYNFALYKLSWCSFNAGDYEGSLKKLQEVVTRSEAAKTKNEVALKWEALRDMVLTWSQLGEVQKANIYYKSVTSREKARDYMSRLAGKYFGDKRSDLAIDTYALLIDEEPNDPRAPEYQSNIVRSYEDMRERDKVVEQMKVLVGNYKPGSAWAVANANNKAAIASAYDLTEGAMRELVTDYHQEAQKTKEVKTYRLAAGIYKDYLDSFADSDYAYNLRYYYAEILWTLEEWEDAAEQYELTYAKDPAGSYSKTAAYNALLAYEKLIAIDKGELERSKLADNQKVDENKSKGRAKTTKRVSASTISKDVKEEAIPKWEQKMIAACDRYAEIAAKDDRIPDSDEINVRYKSAFIYYDRKHFTEAANRFGDIILKWPTDPQAQKAADLSLNILEVKEEWYDLARLSRAFYENKKLARPGQKWTTELAKIMEGSQYKYIDLVVYKKDGKKAEAANMFKDFVKEFPKSQYAAQALRYAMIIFEEAKELDRGIEVGEQILTEYATSEHKAPAMLTLAGFYERTADFTKAAAYYKRYAYEWEESVGIRAREGDKKPNLKKPEDVIKAKAEEARRASDALYNAALWTEGLGRYDEAIALYREYIERYAKMKDGIPAETLAFNIALIREKSKDWSKAEAAFGEFVRNYEKSASAGTVFYARYKQALALQKLGKAGEAAKVLEVCAKEFPKISAKDKKNIDYIDAYAHSLFVMLEPKWKAYVNVKFDNVRTLKKQLQAKVKTTPEMEKAYADVLAVGSGDWGIAALTRIGMMYQDFARNFLDSPDPVGLDDEQLMMYRSELENRAFPLEEKAIEAYEKALAKSYELNVYNEFTLASQDALNRFKPGEYGEIRQVSFTGSEFFSGAPAATSLDATFGSAFDKKTVQADAEKPAEAQPVADAAKAEEKPADEKAAPAPEKKSGTLILDEAAAK
ncbi:tol-pal system YbgF family protein [Vulgatibacter sp.]|uniref:tol-pal system YbgF family protein n=1 Tax=Vulgatibacter sp. TaxID=1971226 RepID=UPI00356892DE